MKVSGLRNAICASSEVDREVEGGGISGDAGSSVNLVSKGGPRDKNLPKVVRAMCYIFSPQRRIATVSQVTLAIRRPSTPVKEPKLLALEDAEPGNDDEGPIKRNSNGSGGRRVANGGWNQKGGWTKWPKPRSKL